MSKLFDDYVAENLSAGDPTTQPTTGFTENVKEAFSLFVDENLSYSEFMHMEGVPFVNEGLTTARNREIIKARQSGQIPDDVWDHYTSWKPYGDKVDFEGLTDYLREDQGRSDILTYDELFNNLRDGLKIKRDKANDVFEHQDSWGFLGQMVGTMGGAAIDPVNLAGGFAMGARAFAGYNALQRVGMAYGIGMGTEAVIQPHVYAWKQAINSEYSGGEAVMSIVAAGGFNAAAEGVSLGLKAGFQTMRQASGVARATGERIEPTLTEGQFRAQEDIDAAEAGLNPLIREMDNAPIGTMDAATHASMVDEADININNIVRQPEMDVPGKWDEIPDAELDQAYNDMLKGNPEQAFDVDADGNVRSVSSVVDEVDAQEKRLTGLLECLRGQ